MIPRMTRDSWIMVLSGIAVIVTVVLFSAGVLYPSPVVSRLQRAHDNEMKRMVRTYENILARERSDTDYYRKAAQTCAAAVAHLEGQTRTLMALVEGREIR